MGLLGNIFNGLVDSLTKQRDRINQYKEWNQNLSDRKLFEKLKNAANSDERIAISELLHERGYGNQ